MPCSAVAPSSLAADAVALLEQLGAGPAVAVGYSMGGPIALLAARRHPAAITGVVLWLGLAPYEIRRGGLRLAGLRDSAETTWVASELVRGSSRDIAEAGRELGGFNARPWLGEIRQPAAVVLTKDDRGVPPRWQRALAKGLGAPCSRPRATTSHRRWRRRASTARCSRL